MRAVATAAATLLAATAAWSVVLAGDGGRGDVALVSMAASVWVATVTAITGVLVARSRWARRLGLVVTAAHGLVALVTSVTVPWVVACALTAVAAVGMGGPWLDGYVRVRPAAAGPPSRSVILPLVLVAVPFVTGLVGGDGWAAAALTGSALATAYWFIRARTGALALVRVVWPVFALALGLVMGWPAGLAAVTGAIAVAVLAWNPTVAVSVSPLVQRGSVVRIPPELAPPQVLDAADLDDRGRDR